jgi:tungstate transport system substrate-binding protein
MDNKMNIKILIIFAILISAFSGCIQESTEIQTLDLSTTTSTCDTGLLDVLNKEFESQNNVIVKTICQGTGKAIATGELGAADVVLVHAPPSELAAVERGNFIDRTFIMYNYFVIIGPASDPAGITDASSATDAFSRIEIAQSPFISRGDDSGTHKKEVSIWNAANITQGGEWYNIVGKGMGDTIMTANTMEGYTLSDRGTYLAMKDNVDSVILFENDNEFLYNPYHVMAVNPEKFPEVNHDMALQYINFLTSDEVQETIKNYGVEEFGEPLFIPSANTIEE